MIKTSVTKSEYLYILLHRALSQDEIKDLNKLSKFRKKALFRRYVGNAIYTIYSTHDRPIETNNNCKH